MLGVAIVILLAAVIITGVVLVAVDANKKTEEKEFFIDSAPLDYGVAENVVYVKRFRDAVTKYLNSISQDLNLTGFADRLLNALSVSRVPAEKLGGMATAINKHSIDGILGSIDGGELTEEQLQEIFAKTSFDFIGEFLNSFFDESGLTGEEFGLFLYNYLNIYGSAEYKIALNAVGKVNFVQLLSCSTYFITSVNDIQNGGGQFVNAFVLQSAFYQLGTVLLKSTDIAGTEVLERVLGLEWHYGDDRDNASDINFYTANLKGKMGYILPLMGCILRAADAETIDVCWDYSSEKNEINLIYSQIKSAKTVKKGMEEFIKLYGEDFGADNITELTAQFKLLTENLYKAQMSVARKDLNDEAFKKILSDCMERIDRFIGSCEYLSGINYTVEEINALSESERQFLAEKAADMQIMEYDADYFISSVIYMWASQRLYEVTKEE